jgi:hypothetical protein
MYARVYGGVCMNVCMYASMYACMCFSVLTWLHISIYSVLDKFHIQSYCVDIGSVNVYVYTVYVYVCVHVCMYVCMYVCYERWVEYQVLRADKVTCTYYSTIRLQIKMVFDTCIKVK